MPRAGNGYKLVFWPTDNFGDISLIKAKVKKIFEEELFIWTPSTTLLQIFFKFLLNSKVIFKSMIGPDDYSPMFCQRGLAVWPSRPPWVWWDPRTLNWRWWRRWYCKLIFEPPENFGDISLIQAKFRKYLKKNCSSELHRQLSFKYFSNFCSIPKLFSKVW